MTQIKKSVVLVILLLIIPLAYGLSVSETKASNPGIKALTAQKTINANNKLIIILKSTVPVPSESHTSS